MQRIVDFIKRHQGAIAVFFCTETLAYVFVEMLSGRVQFIEEVFSQKTPLKLFFHTSIAGLVTLLYELKRSQVQSLKEQGIKITDIAKANEERINSLRSDHDIASNYLEIENRQYSAFVNERLREINARSESKTLIDKIIKISDLSRQHVDSNPNWRLVIEQMALLQFNSLASNRFFLSLEVYCNILVNAIQVLLGECNGRKLKIYSFTAVSPREWFQQRRAIGTSLDGYASKLSKVISELKAGNHEFRRYVLAVDESIADQNDLIGILDFKRIKHDWAENKKQRNTYLDNYHTSRDLAFVLSLHLKGLRFDNYHTEFVFLGFEGNEAKAEWQWCYSCGYTENNLNLSASFVDLDHSTSAERLVIDIPNVSGFVGDESTQEVPNNIHVKYCDFPAFILRTDVAKQHRMENLIPLAEKWHLASEIWHSDKEQELVKAFLVQQIPDTASKILDCACGTGYHSIILKEAGYENLVSSDYDKDNLEIFNRILDKKSLSIDTRVVDWNHMEQGFTPQQFDVVLCLGTSLPYYKSWKEDENNFEFDDADVKTIISKLKATVKPDGKLIIGLSRYINESLTENTLRFHTTSVRDNDSGARDAGYDMTWSFKYDWQTKRRSWSCEMTNEYGDEYSFNLVSHLFDIDQLLEYCRAVFGADNATIFDLHRNNYDMYVVCEVKENAPTTP